MTLGITKALLPNDYSFFHENHPSLPVGSSLSVMGALLLIVRERFYAEPDTSVPYVWVPQENNEFKEDPLKSTIRIEVDSSDETTVKDKRPGIFVSRGPIQSQSLMINDTVGQNVKKDKKAKYSLATGPIRFSCRSSTRGSAEVLGNIMFEWMMYNQEIFRRFFQFHELGPYSLGPEMMMQKQSATYECAIDFRVSWEHRFSTEPRAPRLRQMSLKVRGTYGNDTEEHDVLTKLVLS